MVFDQTFGVVGEELPVSLGFENVIFVMEDLDAASPIVQSRNRARRKHGTNTTLKVCMTRVALFGFAVGCWNSSGCWATPRWRECHVFGQVSVARC